MQWDGFWDLNYFLSVKISQSGVIPKGSTGKWLFIDDLLAIPEGSSVNDNTDETLFFLSQKRRKYSWLRGRVPS